MKRTTNGIENSHWHRCKPNAHHSLWRLLSLLIVCFPLAPTSAAPHQIRTNAADTPRKDLQKWSAPSPDTIPEGPLGDSIRLGRLIFTQTSKYAGAYVGNQQSCSDCHLAAGTAPFASPVVGLPGVFPMFSQRDNRVITLAERIQECFPAQRERPPVALRRA